MLFFVIFGNNGVRQGSILSPYFFAVYIDDLSKEVNKVEVGCFVGKSLVNHLLFVEALAIFALCHALPA